MTENKSRVRSVLIDKIPYSQARFAARVPFEQEFHPRMMKSTSSRPDLRIAVAGLGAIGANVVKALDQGI